MSTAGSSAPQLAPAPDDTSVFARMLNVFIAPSRAFSKLPATTRWWVPVLVVCAIMLAYGYTAGAKIGFGQIAENRLRSMPKVAEMIERLPADKRAEALGKQEQSARRGVFNPAITVVIMNLIVAGVLLGTFNFGLGARLSFTQSLAVVTYSGLPSALRFVVGMLTVLIGVQPDGFNFDNPVASNLGHLFDPASSTFLYWFGSFIDVFAIWTLVVSVIGFSIVGKVTRSSAAFVIFGWYFVFAAAMGGLISLAMSMVK